jgi:hypothetical protein
MSEIDDHIARLKAEKEREADSLFTQRTSRLPDLLKPYHYAYPNDNRRTHVIIPGKTDKIVVTWSGNDIIAGYYVRGEPMKDYNAALLRVDELSNEPTEDQTSETIWQRLKGAGVPTSMVFLSGSFIALGWLSLFRGEFSMAIPFFVVTGLLLMGAAKINAESAK